MKKAVVKISGKQYIVAEEETLRVDLLPEGTKDLTLDALLVIDGDKTEVGTPTVDGVKVKVEVAQLSGNEKYYVWKVIDGEIVKEYVDVYHPEAATKVKYILNGVEAGDTILK